MLDLVTVRNKNAVSVLLLGSFEALKTILIFLCSNLLITASNGVSISYFDIMTSVLVASDYVCLDEK